MCSAGERGAPQCHRRCQPRTVSTENREDRGQCGVKFSSKVRGNRPRVCIPSNFSRPWQAQSIWQAHRSQSRRRSRPRVRARVRARAWAKVVREPRTCCGVGGGIGWSTRHSNMGCSGSKVEAEAARSKEEPGARRAQQQNIESLHSSSPSSRARSHGSVPSLRKCSNCSECSTCSECCMCSECSSKCTIRVTRVALLQV